jgi:transforming growth factor-beta-induced protein
MKRLIFLTLTLVGIFSLAGCSEDATAPSTTANADKSPMGMDRPPQAPSDMTIVEIAEDAGFTLLLDAVGYIAETNPESPLVAGLLDRSQYTVFAPTNDAFIALVEAVAPNLDPDILEEQGPFAAIDDWLGFGTIEAVVSYHVTEGRRSSRSVVPPRNDRVIETLLEGATFSVSPMAMITAVGNTATIDDADISASNGIIHVISAVILPVAL